ncbi:S-adenosylmethionine:tRNA ribosyltransferase-isomerase [Alkalitalea saponilacus]|uniref:S-adenosylmethionine:tRNA ribosyltransferase-isomerase n=1 Tax=Alkalitalea saponilacus TaxID=889453 RepID=A0A1T5CZW0_9BACT|nr:S-adenosylmethionine:tRNA ribosyltransferase-isomerase [Alkalitalea saponilacus]ASB50536.1 S-adenosylmethionine tRNA ribosyltransferase [Alkalitalea saponilacus]SKB64760.1 S-adenosylmethionine:tRNA ribosyltransferase-isomerase [Alkalitalea saponilacus]
MPVPEINISDFNYHLPDERIAKYPLTNRDESNLLVYKNQSVNHTNFKNLPEYLPQNTLLVFNNTRVIRARIHFFKSTGAKIEIFCLEPHNPSDAAMAFQQTQEVEWICLVGNLKKWKGETLSAVANTTVGDVNIFAQLVERINDACIIKFSWKNQHANFADILEGMGQTPIPPYLNRESETIDTERYQTVYSKLNGSVAAPTAGLHFSKTILKNIEEQNHKRLEITLHVGAGTFQPVKSEKISGHAMHTEQFEISCTSIEQLLNHNNPVIAVGTTSVRTLESLYYAGVRIINKLEYKKIGQWDGFEMPSDIPVNEALKALLNHLNQSGETTFKASTSIMVAPGYQFKIINGLITNFHQPKSTLLLLISALIGDNWKAVYEYAMNNDFRFLSYGDSSILIP